MFYRLTLDVMQLKKPRNIKTKPKQVKITKTKNINVCKTIIRYYKFTNSNKQFCGRSNREAFYQVSIL